MLDQKTLKMATDVYHLDIQKAYAEGIRVGREQEAVQKINADGCTGCAYQSTEPWEMPCQKCKRNCRDWWRSAPDQENKK